MEAAAVLLAVSAALLLGAAWGTFWPLPSALKGFIVAMAGGALILSVVLELIQPAVKELNLFSACACVLLGASVFAFVSRWIKKRWGSDRGVGLLTAITLDGVPENLALGVALIGANPMQVAALAGSIFLSNLPEAAGGAKDMSESGRSRGRVFAIWGVTALLLTAAGLVGFFLLEQVSPDILAALRCFAAGAVVASLATEVFPEAYAEDRYWSGLATATGLVAALWLDRLGGG